MKPVSQVSPNEHEHARFPLTDYHFHATAETQTGSSACVLPETESPAFHKLSAEFFNAETRRDSIVEFVLFILIAGVAAWPIVSTIIAVTRLVRNY
jgi:hypothetical protein